MKNGTELTTSSRGRFYHRDNRLVGLSYVGGGAAWMLHLLLAYLLAEFGCIRGWDQVRFLGISLVVWLILLATLVAFAGAAGATLLSLKIGRERERVTDMDDPGETSPSFTARAAFATNLTFLFVIVVETIPIFYFLHDC